MLRIIAGKLSVKSSLLYRELFMFLGYNLLNLFPKFLLSPRFFCFNILLLNHL